MRNSLGTKELLALNTDSRIMWFDDLGTGNEEYRFLSNFFEGKPLSLAGFPGVFAELQEVDFATGEHLFAAMKTLNHDEFFEIATAKPTTFCDKEGQKHYLSAPNHAKSLGRRCSLRGDWEAIKLDVMALVLRLKFTLDREEGQRLLQTGHKLLVEGTLWGDEVWGVDLNKPGYPGRNWLGTLLMARRAELFNEQLGGVLLPTLNANFKYAW